MREPAEGLTAITGASRGLGRHLADLLVATGTPLCLICRHAEDVTGVLSRARAPVYVVEVDLGQTTDIRPKLRHALPQGARIARLINNAGCFSEVEEEDFLNLDDGETWQIATVNGVAVALTARAAMPLMAEGGIVVNILSDMAFSRNWEGTYAIYCAAKAFALAFTVNAAPAMLRRGITMFGVDPGWMKTDMGGSEAPDDPADIAAALLKLLERSHNLKAGAIYLAATGAEIAVP